MSNAGILLRLLLAFSLILNGIGGVLANSDMSAAAGHEASTAAMPAGCHEQVAPGAHAGHGDPSRALEVPAAPAPDENDCCGPGACSCACMQFPALAVTDSLFSPPRLEHEAASEAIEPARPAPPLPHLIRPPIA